MAQLNLQINALSFFDNTSSNNPYLRAFDFTLKLAGLDAKNPDQRPYSVAPQSTQVVYDGTRTVSIDGTTEFDITKPYLDKDVYRFAWNSTGTAPAFRSARSTTITTSSEFSITTNGPISVMTSTSGPFSTAAIQVGDIVNILTGAGPSNANQGKFTVIAKTASSISYQNLNSVAETFTVLDTSLLLVYSHGGSSNQIQIGDTVKISSGFSIATYGNYEVSEVTPEWFEVLVGSPSGIPLETDIVPTASGLVFYKEAKKFVLIAAQQSVSVRFNDDTSDNTIVDPVEPGNAEKSGILLKNGSFYKLVISNTGLSTANIIIATVG